MSSKDETSLNLRGKTLHNLSKGLNESIKNSNTFIGFFELGSHKLDYHRTKSFLKIEETNKNKINNVSTVMHIPIYDGHTFIIKSLSRSLDYEYLELDFFNRFYYGTKVTYKNYFSKSSSHLPEIIKKDDWCKKFISGALLQPESYPFDKIVFTLDSLSTKFNYWITQPQSSSKKFYNGSYNLEFKDYIKIKELFNGYKLKEKEINNIKKVMNMQN